MKLSRILYTLSVLLSFLVISCDKDDSENNSSVQTEKGAVSIMFENTYGTTALSLVDEYTTSLNERITISSLKYIVSNITFIKADGTEFVYPKSQSYFIINQQNRISRTLSLSDIPVGDYVKIRFGLGVDREQFNMGASGQGDFLATAQAEQMLWSWSAGYRFLAYEGTYASETVPDALPFEIHTGQTGTNYNYAEVTLNLSSTAQVHKDASSAISVRADISKIIDGPTKISLTEIDEQGTGATIIGGSLVPVVTTNLSSAFSITSVTNN